MQHPMQIIDEKTKNKIIAVISALMPEVKIYLFGSRARGTNGPLADIDIALDGGKKLPMADVGEINDMFKESNIMYRIEILDLYSVTDLMRSEIQREKIVWKS